jgi:hypothetical protein
MKRRQQAGFNRTTVLVSLAILGVVVAVVLWAIAVHRQQPAKISMQQSDTTIAPSVSQNSPEVTFDPTATCKDAEQLNTNADCKYYKLPDGVADTHGQNIKKLTDIGISLTMPDSLKNITAGNADHPSANSTNVELTKGQCSLGVLIAVQGQAGPGTLYNESAVKQLANEYIAYIAPQSPCQQNSTRADVIQESNDLASLRASFASIAAL